ncbi:MAG: hypothetical protein EXS46_02885 [Candidatus Taylorbacteria bacterium]|nr:hypothetical protein [Candidatus Taylorbacteria bacterium]
MKKIFSDYFPLPKFLEMRPMGLAITGHYVHVVEFVQKGHGIALGRYGSRRIPSGVIQDGYVNDKPAITEILKSLQKELSMEFVRATLPEEKVYLFKTEIPKEAAGNLREAIELRLEENVPIAPADVIFDYAVIPGSEKSDHFDVSVSALPSKVVSTYLDIIKEAGLKPVSFNVEASALRRAMIPKGSLDTFMIVNVREVHTALSIVSKGVVQISLMIPIGGAALTEALAKHFSIDNEEAKKIKEERGFVKNSDNMELFFAIPNTISAIKDEVNKLLVYWQTHKKPSGTDVERVDKIILCGRDANFVGFDEYLSSAMKIPTEIGNVWRNAFSFDDCIPEISHLDSLDYARAIGLALPQ